MSDTTKIIFLRQSVTESILSDIATFVMVVGVIGIGRYLDSSAMQWVGFLLVTVVLIGKAVAVGKDGPRMTPQAAADYLLEKFYVTGKPKSP